MNFWRKGFAAIWRFLSHSPSTRPRTTSLPTRRFVVEIPDALDPQQADKKYTEPLRQILAKENLGLIVSGEQGQANTPDEFSRFITVESDQGERLLEIVGDFLSERQAPVGTFLHVYDDDGAKRDAYFLRSGVDDQ
jgi:hypothetical protein